MAEFDISELPEGCIANVLSLTSPRDTGRLSSISATFRSAADSDAVWRHFLPPDYESIVAHSSDSSSLHGLPLKELYFRLCTNPILIDEGRKSFWLDKWSGKQCYMLSARDLFIVWGDTPRYWGWTSSFNPKSRFPEVAVLLAVCWLEIRGKINVAVLSPSTRYAAYLVFSYDEMAYGFDNRPVEVGVGFVGSEESRMRSVYLDMETRQRQRYQIVPRIRRFNFSNPSRILGPATPSPRQEDDRGEYPKERSDKWWEIELGEFTTGEGPEGELEMSVLEVKGGGWKKGLVIQGIEIRPKDGK
ncbi:putative F-box protein PP2-B12 [Punica granatum]|uniref:F-box protein PP2-B12 n=1 Tax=Punica granatum TaxID=22663 RepID=A0A218XMT9_PUNGR|nr:putative F-box protein PP2-B12 [Punica granatum]XP_031399622.1 putative F-box protein PP2-B12 [Punica granatum]OWM86110.1 hypothetical protein CDL15_Pgr010934 [Punica granatum]